MAVKARKISVDGREFFYRAEDAWLTSSSWKVFFYAQLHNQPEHRLTIQFPVYGDIDRGSGLLNGTQLVSQQSERSTIKLHTPGVAAQLIFYALQAGWRPDQQPMTILDGAEVLRELGYVLPN